MPAAKTTAAKTTNPETGEVTAAPAAPDVVEAVGVAGTSIPQPEPKTAAESAPPTLVATNAPAAAPSGEIPAGYGQSYQTANPMVEHDGPLPETDAQRLGIMPRIVADDIQETQRDLSEPHRVVRVNRTIEEMTIVSGGRARTYNFNEGVQYRVPDSVAGELQLIGAIYPS